MESKSLLTHSPVLLSWHRFGPYHHVRARIAAAKLSLLGLEVSTVDRVNAWLPVEGSSGFRKLTLCPGEDVNRLSATALQKRLDNVLERLNPRVVVIHGYASRAALGLLDWALRHGRPAVVMSESNIFDEPRQAWREWLKARLVCLFSAGLAGGEHGRAYLSALGLPAHKIFLGYDVVDNRHFAEGWRYKHPDDCWQGPFFLASARFIEKKNLFRLLDAYDLYLKKVGNEAWSLAIIGDGELRPKLEAHCRRLGLERNVMLPGYKQYDELPAWYAAASCFVHASTSEQWGLVVNEAMAAGLPVLVSNRCGCAADLVREGVNGFTFDPYDVEEMTRLMFRVAHGDVDRAALGQASREIVAEWGPERFAVGLEQAVEAALSAPAPKPSLLDRALLWALIHR